MKNIKQHLQQFREMSLSRKVQLVSAGVLTIGLMTAIPVYAWFTNQKKAAEMFKVEYPNSLYINAAYREDQKYFEFDAININDYAKDPLTGSKIIKSGEPVFVEKYSYVFSVSGSSTNEFVLQMAHTNNNKFTYKIYDAKQFDDVDDAKSEANNDTSKIIKYTPNPCGHTENPIQVDGDTYVDAPPENLPPTALYYVKGNAIDGTYRNPKIVTPVNAGNDGEGNNGEGNEEETTVKLAEKDTNESFYFNTYGDNLKVDDRAVPLYWQGNVSVTTDANKNFCKYFILEVSWDEDEQDHQLASKETDMVYFSVKRIS